ncbi:hypothetical protein D3OALGB2SA_2450 [Olavius algarvensis associated proteobacterium Delta 3]|nr:hypothetical protein D3OALGB2SA_2450 [Olavius algarvensis associated proteobacterium Delta 3]
MGTKFIKSIFSAKAQGAQRRYLFFQNPYTITGSFSDPIAVD